MSHVESYEKYLHITILILLTSTCVTPVGSIRQFQWFFFIRFCFAVIMRFNHERGSSYVPQAPSTVNVRPVNTHQKHIHVHASQTYMTRGGQGQQQQQTQQQFQQQQIGVCPKCLTRQPIAFSIPPTHWCRTRVFYWQCTATRLCYII